MTYGNIKIERNPRTKSSYYARFYCNGRQRTISGKTQEECYKKVKSFLKPTNIKNLTREECFNPVGRLQNYTFLQWHTKWLKEYHSDYKEATLKLDRTLTKTVGEKFGNTKMINIRPIHIQEQLNKKKTTPRQAQKLYDYLNSIFESAKNNGIIPINIVKTIKKPKHQKRHSDALTEEQIEDLINTCNSINNGDLVLISLYQGLRRGEVLGLTRNSLDFENRKIVIDKAWSDDNQFTSTKNENSVRVIPMFNRTYNILIKYKDKLPNERIFNVTEKAYQWVINQIRKKSLLLKNVKLKDMRATFITNCSTNLIPLHCIQQWVGHSIGSKVTAEVYTSYKQEDGDKFISYVDAFQG